MKEGDKLTNYSQKDRNLALQRALKWTKLFSPNFFDNIVDAAIAGDSNAFNTAVQNVTGMSAKEKEWLWNYLQHCGTLWKDNDVFEAAAGTGW